MLPNMRGLIETGTYLFVFAVVFAESGLLIGFFLPGDSLLFTAGFLASQNIGGMNIAILCLGSFIAAVIGDSVGYSIGKSFGRRLFQREDSIWFHKRNVVKAEEFFVTHGGKAIVLARFTPIIRTFVPLVAGIGSMRYSHFVAYNVIGGFIWAVGVSLGGFYFGKLLPPEQVDKYLLPVIALIIILSLLPSIVHVWRESGGDIVAWLRRRLAGQRA